MLAAGGQRLLEFGAGIALAALDLGMLRDQPPEADGEIPWKSFCDFIAYRYWERRLSAYKGMFYVTGSQYYEGCWQRRAKEKIDGVLKKLRRTIRAKLLSGLAVPLSWRRAWIMLDLLSVPHHLRQQKMQRR